MNVIGRNNVKIIGRGEKVMIFAHGYGCNQSMWDLMTPAFAGEYQLVLFDLTGAGNSDISAYDRVKYSTLQGYAQDVIEICRELDLTNTIYVGHSVSSIIGILASIQEPSLFEKLVLIGPSPCYMNDGDYNGGFAPDAINEMLKTLESGYDNWAKAMGPVIMGQKNKPELGQQLTQSFCKTKPEIAKHFAHVTFTSDNRKDLKRVTVPTLVLQCTEDAIASEAVGQYVHREIKGSTYTLLKATGHCPHMSAPHETAGAIKRFLTTERGAKKTAA